MYASESNGSRCLIDSSKSSSKSSFTNRLVTSCCILDLLLKIKERENLTIVIITHEMHVIRRVCDEVAVMECKVFTFFNF
jgi:ABC-type antimicrobial peptide transport system ATPase subunit